MSRGDFVILGERSNKYTERTCEALWITERNALENGWNVIRADYGVEWTAIYGPGYVYSNVLMVLKNEDGEPVGISIACKEYDRGEQ